ncbi:MAG: alpha/beta fold hydrolase [Gemmatimonadota bacterium]|nr:MAG: alpha/beta fold hydrolase [Gemmatimonadota bacterium]
MKRKAFELVGSDGGPLRGEVRTAGGGEDRPAVVICHGFKGFKDWGFFPRLAERLATAGMTAVSFNFSGSGVGPDGESFSEPERFGRCTYTNDLADLATVTNALTNGDLLEGMPGTEHYGLFGHSRGGGIAVLHAALQPAVGALVTWAAIAKLLRWDVETIERWRATGKQEVRNARTGEILTLYTNMLDDIESNRDLLDIPKAAAAIEAPWLIIHGADDESVPVAEARQLMDCAKPSSAELKIISGGKHTLGAKHPWDGYSRELHEAMDATVAWFANHLP